MLPLLTLENETAYAVRALACMGQFSGIAHVEAFGLTGLCGTKTPRQSNQERFVYREKYARQTHSTTPNA